MNIILSLNLDVPAATFCRIFFIGPAHNTCSLTVHIFCSVIVFYHSRYLIFGSPPPPPRIVISSILVRYSDDLSRKQARNLSFCRGLDDRTELIEAISSLSSQKSTTLLCCWCCGRIILVVVVVAIVFNAWIHLLLLLFLIWSLLLQLVLIALVSLDQVRGSLDY